jgi:prepilin peptidase CpaA
VNGSAAILERDAAAPVAAAALAGGALFGTGAFGSAAGVALVGLLMAAVAEDVRRRRIPNLLTLPGLAAALVYSGWTAGAAGLLSALAGAGAALAVLAVPFAMRWLGAGDVKAVMALGAFFGADALPSLLFWSTLFGGVFALATLIADDGGRDLLRRWRGALALSALSRRLVYIGPRPGSAAAAGLPFGVALALGVAAHGIWGLTWLS